MWKKIGLALVILVAGFLVFVALRPAEFRVERSLTMFAPAALPFAEANDFHRWVDWSPWAKLDPNVKTTYTGAPTGLGSVYTWEGNSQVGKGRMEVLESKPDELVKIKLDFLAPFQASNTSEFSFKPEGKQTVVTWSMYGKNNYMAKAMTVFMSMDKMVGGDFEKGLAQMKAVVEEKAKQ